MIQKHIDILRKEWYRLNNMSTKDMDARQLAIHIGQKSGIIKAMHLLNLHAGAEQNTEETIQYSLSTHEEQSEFAKKRNYHYTNTDNPIDFPK